MFNTQFIFAPDNACCVVVGMPPCTEGHYFITDALSNGNFAGKIDASDGSPDRRMDEIRLDDSGEVDKLHFRLSDGAFATYTVDLTRAD